MMSEDSNDVIIMTGVDIEKGKEAESGEEALKQKLEKAKAAYQKAQQDLNDATSGWGWWGWLPYIFYTSGKASTAEHMGFSGARVGLLYGISNIGFALSYLLPASDMSQIQAIDNASNTTSATQSLTDRANVKYYWGGGSSYGLTALGSIAYSLYTIRATYLSMKQRVLEEAQKEREKADEKMEEHKGVAKRLKAVEQQNTIITKALKAAQDGETNANAKLTRARREVQDLTGEVQDLTGDVQGLTGELQQAKGEKRQLKAGLAKAQEAAAAADKELKAAREEAERLRSELRKAKGKITELELTALIAEMEATIHQTTSEVLIAAQARLQDSEDKVLAAVGEVKNLTDQAEKFVSKDT